MSLFLTYDAEAWEYHLTSAGYAALVVLMILALLASAAVFGKESRRMSTKQLAYCSIAIALATVASFLKLASLPFGGSITLFSMFFICLIGYLYGPKTGLMTGVAYGILQLLVEPYIYAPIQVLLDYPLAFGALGLSGIFWKSRHGLIKGCIVGMAGRYICHVISGYVFFAAYTPEGMNPILYAVGYNATYILPELIATVILISIPAVGMALNQIKRMAYTG